ncbi:uncharacterized protein LOC116208383 isoform X2 [Punica granatum]|uniref:Uncharacterized protein LOC116208383 isoform X2 n=1 Tax=Punica granatum TaxID=22663 RepID=A0A6P8DTF0_PUNGR|nr:uncharacterized protein LOC116208383 isoform X2 [Punica granatum]
MASNKSPSSSDASFPRAVERCTICLLDLSPTCGRTVVTLRCSHTFHLDCIGSAFNSKRVMECPNCREVEAGQWRFSELPEYQWCPNHGWGWSVHTVDFGQVDETDDHVVITDEPDDLGEPVEQDGPHENGQQENFSLGSTAEANKIPDLNAVPEPMNPDGSLNPEPSWHAYYGEGSGEVPESSAHRRSDGVSNLGTLLDSHAHNDRVHLSWSATRAAVQINHPAGTSSSFLPAPGRDSILRGALETLSGPRLHETHVVALPVQGNHMFSIRRTLHATGQYQNQTVAHRDNFWDMEMEAMSPFEHLTPADGDLNVEAAATEGNEAEPNQEPSN